MKKTKEVSITKVTKNRVELNISELLLTSGWPVNATVLAKEYGSPGSAEREVQLSRGAALIIEWEDREKLPVPEEEAND